MSKAWVIFLGVVLITLSVHSYFIKEVGLVDWEMWVNQLQYLHTFDPLVFDMRGAYAYPGTPPLMVAVLASELGATYSAALTGSLALINALTLGALCVLCHKLRPQTNWWLAAAGLLVFNRLLLLSTPPTFIVIPFVALLSLLTLYLYENPSVRTRFFIYWALAAGLTIATRIDIGLAVAGGLGLLLLTHLPIKKSLGLIAGTIIIFILVNPFMWVMPLVHIADIWHKLTFHYADFAPAPLSLLAFFFISPLALVSLSLTATRIIVRYHVPLPLPLPFLLMCLGVTFGISGIILTSQLQAPRYFYPLATFWEILLPLFVIDIAPYLKFDFISRPAAKRWQSAFTHGVIWTLVVGQIVMVFHLILLPDIILVYQQTQLLSLTAHRLFSGRI